MCACARVLQLLAELPGESLPSLHYINLRDNRIAKLSQVHSACVPPPPSAE